MTSSSLPVLTMARYLFPGGAWAGPVFRLTRATRCFSGGYRRASPCARMRIPTMFKTFLPWAS